MKKGSVAKIRICKVPGCGRKYHAKGYCSPHASKIRRWGQLECPNDTRGKNPNSIKNLTYSIPIGNIPWNKDKNRVSLKCPNCGKINSVLKGRKGFCNKSCHDNYQVINHPVSYGGIHSFVRRYYGVPKVCENCGKTEDKKFEWANVSGKYILDKSDWIRLCCSCHRKFDLGTKNRIEVGRNYAIS